LRAGSDDAAAVEYVARALAVLRKKERAIASPDVRHRFLTRVPLNRGPLREAQLLESGRAAEPADAGTYYRGCRSLLTTWLPELSQTGSK
jgi:hypothetical protein